jgi:hypothetical protein
MIRIFKLITGEEIISKVTSGSEIGYHLDNPASVLVKQTNSGMGIALAPFLPYTKEDLYLFKHSIALEGTADDQLANEYNRIFGSGIVVAPASALYTG